MKPTAVIDYNERVGGMDAADHYISTNMFVRKTKKWWRKMFLWLMEVSVVNSYLLNNTHLQNEGKRGCDSKSFRNMMLEFVGPSGTRTAKDAVGHQPSAQDKEERLNQKPHFIESFLGVNQKEDCDICRNRKVPSKDERPTSTARRVCGYLDFTRAML